MKLHVDGDDLAACVACGLCLPHCPTYRVTGEETASPRGRIAAMRQVDAGLRDPDAEFVGYMDACVQCRGCEAACPSAVPFGRLMEGTRETLASLPAAHYQPRWRRLGYQLLGHHRLLLALCSAVGVGQRLRLVPRRLSPGPVPIRRGAPVRPTGGDVWLFTGCVMDAWFRPVHVAVARVLGRLGAGVALPGLGGACCGALHVHAGLADDARVLARRVMASMPGDRPVLVDAAGCGAALKDYGRLLGTPEAAQFSERVMDIHEWLAPRVAELPRAPRTTDLVAVQDPCHLRHVQHAHQHVRAVLAPYVPIVELDDDGLCCGAGGAYAALQPDLARGIRARKLDAIARSGAAVVASANPGCALHLSAAGVRVRHPIELLDDALEGIDSDGR